MIDTSVSQETVNAVMQRLDALAAKLGVTAQYMREDNCDDYPWVLAGIGTVVVIILFVMAMSGFYTALGEWLNPQFWALDALFKAIR
jgi:hypothetical protein